MKYVRLLVVAFSAVSLLVMPSGFAAAEVFLDFYGGASFPEDESVKVEALGAFESKRVTYDTSFTLGARATAWGEHVGFDWLGMAVDISYFAQKTDNSAAGSKTEIMVFPLTLLLMFRYPGEVVRPYVGIGGGLFISSLEQDVDLSFAGVSGSGTVKDIQADVGFDARAGLAVKVHEKVSIFGEGRYTSFRPAYSDEINGVKVGVKTDSEVFHLLGGISLDL